VPGDDWLDAAAVEKLFFPHFRLRNAAAGRQKPFPIVAPG
jgi:hypothetical protein